jgi:hypothetical protein
MMGKYPPSVALTKTLETRSPIVPRRYARAAVDIPVDYAIEGTPGWRTGRIDDLGGGGVRLQTQDDIAAGTIVSLRFEVEQTQIRVTSRIAMSLHDRARECYVHGAAFTSIDPSDRLTIVAHVTAQGGPAES